MRWYEIFLLNVGSQNFLWTFTIKFIDYTLIFFVLVLIFFKGTKPFGDIMKYLKVKCYFWMKVVVFFKSNFCTIKWNSAGSKYGKGKIISLGMSIKSIALIFFIGKTDMKFFDMPQTCQTVMIWEGADLTFNSLNVCQADNSSFFIFSLTFFTLVTITFVVRIALLH